MFNFYNMSFNLPGVEPGAPDTRGDLVRQGLGHDSAHPRNKPKQFIQQHSNIYPVDEAASVLNPSSN